MECEGTKLCCIPPHGNRWFHRKRTHVPNVVDFWILLSCLIVVLVVGVGCQCEAFTVFRERDRHSGAGFVRGKDVVSWMTAAPACPLFVRSHTVSTGCYTIPRHWFSSEKAARALLDRPSTQGVSGDRKLFACDHTVTEDPWFREQWHVKSLQVLPAWDMTQGKGVVVAVVDGGVDAAHPDLKGAVLAGWNVVQEDEDTRDFTGHGTALAAIVAARAGNDIGGVGIAPHAKILPVKVSAKANSTWAYVNDIARGLVEAARRGARVAVLGYDVPSEEVNLERAIEYFGSRGGLVFAPIGNGFQEIDGLAWETLVRVSATTRADTFWPLSNYGPLVDLAAPGEDILTANLHKDIGLFSGTSYAAPMAAGVAALVLSLKPNLSPKMVKDILLGSSVDLGPVGFDVFYGWGRLHALEAVLKADSYSNEDFTAPWVEILTPCPRQEVQGWVQVVLDAGDWNGPVKVVLTVDQQRIRQRWVPPYRFFWNTEKFPDGPVTLQAMAVDAAGHQTFSQPVVVWIANTTGKPRVP